MTFQVTLQPSNHTFEVQRDESVLDAALREGLGIPYGCRNGSCLSCRARIIEGEVEYADSADLKLGAAQKDAGWALLCQATPKSDLVAEVKEFSVAADLTIRTLPCRVMRKHQVADDVMILELKLPENEKLHYLPGQYVDVLMRDSRRRSFSIANAPADDGGLSLHVRLVPDGEFSGHVFRHLKERALLRIRGPLGGFFLRDDSRRPLLFVAGGTGFAPVKSIIESLLAADTQRPIHLYWGARALADLYLDGTVRQWQDTTPGFQYVPVLSEPKPDDHWTGRTGFVHQAVLDDFNTLDGYDVYSSGPPVMVDSAWRTFAERGLPANQHFSDAFEFAYETGADTI